MDINTVGQSFCSTRECGYNNDSSCCSVSSKDTNMYSIFHYLLICPWLYLIMHYILLTIILF